MTIAEAAELVGVSSEYIRQMIHAGKVKAKLHGRTWIVSKSSLNAFKRKREESMANA